MAERPRLRTVPYAFRYDALSDYEVGAEAGRLIKPLLSTGGKGREERSALADSVICLLRAAEKRLRRRGAATVQARWRRLARPTPRWSEMRATE